MEDVITFGGDHELREKAVSMAREHREQDRLIHGEYWQRGSNSNGCSVGCFTRDFGLDSYSHEGLARKLLLPIWLVDMQEYLFEALGDDGADFHVDFYESIPVGVSIEHVLRDFLHWVLVDEEHGVIGFAYNPPDVIAVVSRVAELIRSGEPWGSDDMKAAAEAAWAAWAAWAARAARAAWAAWAAWAAGAAGAAEAAGAAGAAEAQSAKLLSLLSGTNSAAAPEVGS